MGQAQTGLNENKQDCTGSYRIIQEQTGLNKHKHFLPKLHWVSGHLPDRMFDPGLDLTLEFDSVAVASVS